ncbi:hypothetical protein [Stutzerimonas xanthomarina]|uniref:hypothetical protein n=1 Tax=Stutzerimonas xanthomarina TaxID=271420 RepID=UPI003AA90850
MAIGLAFAQPRGMPRKRNRYTASPFWGIETPVCAAASGGTLDRFKLHRPIQTIVIHAGQELAYGAISSFSKALRRRPAVRRRGLLHDRLTCARE